MYWLFNVEGFDTILFNSLFTDEINIITLLEIENYLF